MGHDHHSHTHHSHDGSAKNLRIAFFLNLGFTLLEIVGGFFVNSVAILSDALHDLGDSLSIGLSLYLHNKSKQKKDKHYSFGYIRFSLLGALVNSLVLILGSIYVVYEAVSRIMSPEPPDAQGMMVLAVIGVLLNGYAALKVKKGSSLNEKVISLHLLEDVLGWVAVLTVAIILMFVDLPVLDPLLSLAITLYILFNVVKRLRSTLRIFLQGVPEGLDLKELEHKIKAVPHVHSLHHTHVWSLEGESHVFTSHLKLKNIHQFSQIIESKEKVKAILKDYPFSHYTIETELDEETCELKED